MIKEICLEALFGQEVRIYRNLLNGRISVQHYTNKKWLLAGHVTDIVLKNVRFKISEPGRQRVLHAKRKNVHAWAIGTAIYVAPCLTSINLAYDPYRCNYFYERETLTQIVCAKYLVVENNIVRVSLDAISPQPQQLELVSSLDTLKSPQHSNRCHLTALGTNRVAA